MRLYCTKDEAERLVSALRTAPGQEEIDLILIERIEKCMEEQKPHAKKNPPDEAER